MRITNPEIIELRDILVSALTLVELDDVTLHLDQPRGRITLGSNLNEIYREVIIWFNNRSRTHDLLAAVRAVNPTDPDLYRFDQRHGRATQLPPEAAAPGALERIVREELGMVDARAWLERAAAVENCICLVRTALGALGTGFLIGPDVVMTNYHVVEPYILGQRDPAGLQFRFDFMLTADGGAPGPGTTFHARLPGWLIDSSAYHPSEKPGAAQTTVVEVPPDLLDYAVIRLDGRPGDQPIGALALSETRAPRGRLRLPEEPYKFAERRALLVLHHAQGRPLQLSLDTDSFVAANVAGTRVFHRTNTEAGSSGSPCFDLDWNLAALHHGYATINGDPVNRAVPLTPIIELLDERGKLGEIGN